MKLGKENRDSFEFDIQFAMLPLVHIYDHMFSQLFVGLEFQIAQNCQFFLVLSFFGGEILKFYPVYLMIFRVLVVLLFYWQRFCGSILSNLRANSHLGLLDYDVFHILPS